MNEPVNLTWYKFKTRQGRTLEVAVYGQNRYTIAPTGFLMVSMKYGETSLYEGMFRAKPNARAYAAEIARNGGLR